MNETEPLAPRAPDVEGWQARFIGSEPRLSEVAEMYREIGFEVMLKPFETGSCAGCCTTCFEGPADKTMVIYTRETAG